MIYGKGCKGNYQKLAKLARITPIFPDIENKRSMIYIDNLSEFIKKLIENGVTGIFMPQNAEYITTSILVKEIAKNNGQNMYMIPVPVLLKNFLIQHSHLFKKIFGDLMYSKNLSICHAISFCESITKTEKFGF